jgi:hypothetical protein
MPFNKILDLLIAIAFVFQVSENAPRLPGRDAVV